MWTFWSAQLRSYSFRKEAVREQGPVFACERIAAPLALGRNQGLRARVRREYVAYGPYGPYVADAPYVSMEQNVPWCPRRDTIERSAPLPAADLWSATRSDVEL